MKKTLFACALAGAAFAVHAQNAPTSVTLYGIVDTGYLYDKTDGQKAINAIQTGNYAQSRWGVRGTENLGNGLNAIFMFESAIATDDGSLIGGRLFNRNVYVGLRDDRWGELRIGRTTVLAFEWASFVASPFNLGYGRGTVGTTFAYNDTEFGGGRVSNAVYYFTPTVSGFQAAAGYSFQITGSEVEGGDNNNRLANAGIRYTNGPLRAVVTYEAVQAAGAATNPQNLTTAVAYNFGPISVNAGYAKLHNSSGATYGARQDNAYSIGASVPLGERHDIAVAYQKATGSKLSNWGVGYTYDLSKRTLIYAFANKGDTTPGPVATRKSQKQFSLGIQHKF